MRRMLAVSASAIAALVAATALAAHAYYAAPARWQNQGIEITPQTIKLEGDRLDVKVQVWNRTDRVVLINRDLVTCKLPDGRVVGRYKGMMAGWGMGSPTHTLAPHGMHEVWMQFVVGKAPPAAAAIQWNGAVTANGRPLALPDYTVTLR